MSKRAKEPQCSRAVPSEIPEYLLLPFSAQQQTKMEPLGKPRNVSLDQ